MAQETRPAAFPEQPVTNGAAVLDRAMPQPIGPKASAPAARRDDLTDPLTEATKPGTCRPKDSTVPNRGTVAPTGCQKGPQIDVLHPSAYSIEHSQPRIHWNSYFRQWALAVAFQHGERLMTEPKTRAELNGRYFHDWFSVVRNYRYNKWNDGDKFFTSNIAHPLQGAFIESIFWQNNDRVRFLSQDFHNPAYRKALLQAFSLAAVDSVQWKLGPVSEATIGHVGLPTRYQGGRNRTGLNDLVMNEVGGTPMLIGFQWLDKHLQRGLVESRYRNHMLINTSRVFTNPPQSLANIFRFKSPWYRDSAQGPLGDD